MNFIQKLIENGIILSGCQFCNWNSLDVHEWFVSVLLDVLWQTRREQMLLTSVPLLAWYQMELHWWGGSVLWGRGSHKVSPLRYSPHKGSRHCLTATCSRTCNIWETPQSAKGSNHHFIKTTSLSPSLSLSLSLSLSFIFNPSILWHPSTGWLTKGS